MIQIKTDSWNLIEAYQNMSDLYNLCRIENDFTFWGFNFMFYILFVFTSSVIMSTVHIHEGFSAYDFILGSVTSRKKFSRQNLKIC